MAPIGADEDADVDEDADEDAALELPIDGTLDLHTFSPRDLRTLILDYLGECLERGIFELRIIHGKGQGVLRRTVHSLLQRDPRVAAFQLADESGGGWGATATDPVPDRDRITPPVLDPAESAPVNPTVGGRM